MDTFPVATAGSVAAGEADAVRVDARGQPGRCEVRVTVANEDTGRDHYADHWRVPDTDGQELVRRVLLHPHVDEPPFTRTLSREEIPDGIARVVPQAQDRVDGHGGEHPEVGLR